MGKSLKTKRITRVKAVRQESGIQERIQKTEKEKKKSESTPKVTKA